MFHIRVPQTTATIQLLKFPNRTNVTIANQERRQNRQIPPEQEFISVFDLTLGSSFSKPIQAQSWPMKVKKVNSYDDVSTTVQRMQRESSTPTSAGVSSLAPDFNQPGFWKFQEILKTDCLNVIGEDHIESNEKRDEELKFCSEYAKSSNYWYEDEFPQIIDESRICIKADPLNLGFFQYIQFLKEMLHQFSFPIKREGSFFSKLFNPSYSYVQLLSKIASEGFKRERESYWERIKNSLLILGSDVLKTTEIQDNNKIYFLKTENLLDLLEKQMPGKSQDKYRTPHPENEYNAVWHQDTLSKIARLHPFVYEVILNFSNAYDVENDKLNKFRTLKRSETSVTTDELFFLINNIKISESHCQISLNNLTAAIEKENLVTNMSLTFDQITKERSRLMHIAAEENHKKVKGVWKIGDAHVEDIKGKNGSLKPYGNISYNLLERAEFQDALNKYIALEAWLKSQNQKIPAAHQYGL